MRAEPVKMQTGPGWYIDLIPEDDAEREILLGMFDKFFEGKRKPWIASIDYTDNKLKSMTLRMVRRSKFRKTVRSELARLNEITEALQEKSVMLYNKVRELEDRTGRDRAEYFLSSSIPPTEHKCDAMPVGNVIKRHYVKLAGKNCEAWWRLHFPNNFETDLAPRVALLASENGGANVQMNK